MSSAPDYPLPVRRLAFGLVAAVGAGFVVLALLGYYDPPPLELAAVVATVAVFGAALVGEFGETALFQVLFGCWMLGWGALRYRQTGDPLLSVPFGLGGVPLGGYYARVVAVHGWDARTGGRAGEGERTR